MPRSYRLRDAVHGLIVFDETSRQDQLAWKLISTPEFQRLRRIKQLGVSEFVFPGATHTRFAHCIGVFHTARMLIKIIEGDLLSQGEAPDEYREDVAVIAALLHDIGHGPFSHAFEHAYASVLKKRDPNADVKDHEQWTAEIIINPDGFIRPLLDAYSDEFLDGAPLAEDIADLLTRAHPKDIYHAVVSSSFDADRLDYLRRDKLMTGSGAGGIDFDWLLNNLVVADIDPDVDIDSHDATGPHMGTPSFCLKASAAQAAEAFVLARYHLYTQVYFHKTTRCVEAMIDALLGRFASLCADGKVSETGVARDHPLVIFLTEGQDSLSNYLHLDDTVVWAAIGGMRQATDKVVSDLAARLLDRRLYKVLDCDSAFTDDEARRRMIKRVRTAKAAAEPFTILEDQPRLSAYGEVKQDDTKAHKRLMIRNADGSLVEITKSSPVVKALDEKVLNRFFFVDAAARDSFK